MVLAFVIIGWLWHLPLAFGFAGVVGLLGLVHYPSRLRMLKTWARLTGAVGRLLQTLLLALVFFLLLTPLGLWRRGMDRYSRASQPSPPSSNWQTPEPREKDHFLRPG